MFVNHACAAWAFGPYAKSAVTLMMPPWPLVMGVYSIGPRALGPRA